MASMDEEYNDDYYPPTREECHSMMIAIDRRLEQANFQKQLAEDDICEKFSKVVVRF